MRRVYNDPSHSETGSVVYTLSLVALKTSKNVRKVWGWSYQSPHVYPVCPFVTEGLVGGVRGTTPCTGSTGVRVRDRLPVRPVLTRNPGFRQSLRFQGCVDRPLDRSQRVSDGGGRCTSEGGDRLGSSPKLLILKKRDNLLG